MDLLQIYYSAADDDFKLDAAAKLEALAHLFGDDDLKLRRDLYGLHGCLLKILSMEKAYVNR